MKEHIRGSLFDRLIDWEPYVEQVSPSIKTLTREELKNSIQQELTRLLNTTCSFSRDQMEDLERNTLTYGIHDFSGFFPDSSDNRTRLSNVIREVIEAFEPRLKKVSVAVEEMNNQNDRFSLALIIDAELEIDTVTEPITFIMAID
jgi:type VI secretion system protein ImpF